jgi:predicted HTH transcriptional regulator
MIKGRYDTGRESKTQAFIKQIKADRFTYKRFVDRIDLKKEVSAWLVQVVNEVFGVVRGASVAESAEETIEAASNFEVVQQDEMPLSELDVNMGRLLFSRFYGSASKRLTISKMAPVLRMRGLVWQDGETGDLYPTAGGVAFLGKNPALRFPQCQVLADAYREVKATAKPFAQNGFSGPIPKLIEYLLAFVYKNTQHPTRIVGINKIELNEYPIKAVREALVNAFAHRDYEDSSRKIRLEIFKDRLVISSPGYPPKPLTLAKLRRGRYESCRRNPVIAECMAALDLMEQRGTGFERIRAAMEDHGLGNFILEQRDGYFKVILPGPDGDFDRLRTPSDVKGIVPPSVETQLNQRQKKIMIQVQQEGRVTSGWCRDAFGVTYNTAYRDLSDLVKRKLLIQRGQGRATRYELDIEGQ